MDFSKMRERFNENIAAIISRKREDNKAFLNSKEYNDRIADVKQSKTVLQTPGLTKTTRHYRIVRKYDVQTVNGKECLIKPVAGNSKQVLCYVKNEELFDILHSSHFAIGHGGRNRMVAELKNKYCNITKESIMGYLRLCAQCQKKSCNPKKVLISKPVLYSARTSRAQVDLIDMQSQNYNDFRFIMVYQDHLTKFVVLRALRSNCAKEIAFHLLEIYTTFGAPVILQSDNGREFVNSVLIELHAMWKDLKIVPGKPRHNQSQGSVEHANRDIKDMLAAWMTENKCSDWPTGIKFIQFQKNRALHSGIGRSPYEAMFGCPAKVGLASAGVPLDVIQNLSSEDVEMLRKQQSAGAGDSESEEDLNLEASSKDELLTTNIERESTSAEIQTEPEAVDRVVCMRCFKVPAPAEDANQDGFCLYCQQHEVTANERKRSVNCSEKQDNKLMRLSNNKFSDSSDCTR